MYANRRRLTTTVGLWLIGLTLCLPIQAAWAFNLGDILITLESGGIQWRNSSGTLLTTLTGSIPGIPEGLAFDAAGNMYVSRWCADAGCLTGNTVERFNPSGASTGSFGTGYNCNPHDIVFDPTGTAYVGQADCTGDILKLAPGQPPVNYADAPENRGTFWIDLAPDHCTIYYTSEGKEVKRFNVCTNTQLADFNGAMPGDFSQELRFLPDGTLLVSTPVGIVRLDTGGNIMKIYSVANEGSIWSGVDYVGDGTFWAANFGTSNVYHFDLATGAVLGGFNTGTPGSTVVALRSYKPGAGNPGNTPPSIQLGLNQAGYRSGDTLRLSATTAPGTAANTVDLYVAVQLPGGSLLFLTPGGGVSGTMQPLRSNFNVTAGNSQIFQYRFGGGEPSGGYIWYAGFTTPGVPPLGGIVGTIASDPFSFSP